MDTPGFTGIRGTAADNENFDKIMTAVVEGGQLDAIIFVINATPQLVEYNTTWNQCLNSSFS